LAILLVLAAPGPVAAQEDVVWSDLFGRAGVHGGFSPLVTDALSDGENLWVSGRFESAGSARTRGIARWDGSSWHSLGEGITPAITYGPQAHTRIVRLGEDLVVAGEIAAAGGQPVDNVARWDGTDWHAMGNGLNARVNALIVHEGELLAGGEFTHSGTTHVGQLARWTGSGWERFADVEGYSVEALGEYQGDLVIAGLFEAVDSVSTRRIARFDGEEWHPLGLGVDKNVYALQEHDGLLWVGGTIREADSLSVFGIATWNGSSWGAVNEGTPNGIVRDFVVHSGHILVGVSSLGPWNHVAVWSDGEWVPAFDEAVPGGVYALASHGDAVFVGGNFAGIGDCPCERGALWDDGSWNPMGSGYGLNGRVHALLERDGILYAGGTFSAAGDVPVENVAAWDGVQPLVLGAGLSGPVYCLAEFDGRIVAGGYFRMSGSQSVERVAAWDGVSWGPLGAGFNYIVRALFVHDGQLFAGGNFDEADGSTALHVARWDGSAWHAVGEGFRDTENLASAVLAFTEWNGDLYAGGRFTFSGQEVLSHVARWTGSDWVSVGRYGLESAVYTLHPHDSLLYAGGAFRRVEGTTATGLAAWDGISWSPVNWPGDTSVRALATYHDDLLVAPVTEYEEQGHDLARLRDGEWTVYPTGSVQTSAVVGEALFLGGSLTYVDDKASVRLARLRDNFWESASVPDHPEVPTGTGPSLQVAAPFRPGGALLVSAPPNAHATVDLFDVAGRRVTRLFAGELPPGGRTLHWDGNTSAGAAAAGVYFVRLESAGGSRVEKLVLVR
jgi:hypothetical protein